MKTRTKLAMSLAGVAYLLLLLPFTRARAQAQPAEPAVPATPALPAFAALPAIPAPPTPPVPPAAPAWYEHSSTTNWGGPVTDCADLHIRLDGERPTVQSEEKSISRGEARALRVHEIRNGGIQVSGWDKDTYSVTACKAAIGDRREQLLSQIRLSVQGGEVSVSEPSGDRDEWTVHLLIRTPKSADIEVSTHNGPVAFYSVDGKITTRATNGPITVEDCSGEADIRAENGPISFTGKGGKLRLHTQNGPITVRLGENWDGSGLVADAVNGPVTLRVPSGFHSSFLVESNGNGPVSCRASICSEARKTWDDDHKRIEYGSGSPVIRLSTENGPVSVAD